MKLSPEDLNYYNSHRSDSVSKMACWSPVKNLFIGLRGKIMTCCYNKAYLLGEYPSHSLHEIWFGEKRKELTESLKENDFSKGCQNCLEVIRARNMGGLTAKKFDHLPLNETYPTRIDFELSNECNLECIMCRGEFSSSIRKNVEKLPPIQNPYNKDLLAELKEFIPHLVSCHFLGGEPFLIPIYLDIWDLIAEINPSCRISILTNGTILSDRVKHILEKINCDVGVSIDSIHSDTYALIRKNGNLEKVKTNINYLRDYTLRKKTNFYISSCAMNLNAHEFVDLTAYANSLNCEVFFTRVTYPRALSLEIKSKEELTQIIHSIRNASLPKNTQVEMNNHKTLNDLANHLEHWGSNRLDISTPDNLTEYFTELHRFLQQKSPNEYASLYTNIENKLLYLLEIARNNHTYDEAQKKICEVPYKTLYEMVPSIEKEHLLHLFQTFIIPIENTK